MDLQPPRATSTAAPVDLAPVALPPVSADDVDIDLLVADPIELRDSAPRRDGAVAPFPFGAFLVCFVSGAAILMLEIAAFRLLAPYFGTSSYVTGAILNTILGALAVGYWLGGWYADRRPVARQVPYAALSAAGVLVLVMPYRSVLERLDGLPTLLGAALAVLVSVALPCALLSAVPPYFVKQTLREGREGRAAGAIYGLSTIGSIAGGSITAFLLLPLIGTRLTLLATGTLLLVVGVAGLGGRCCLLFGLPLANLFLAPAPVRDYIHESDSQYNVIRVRETENARHLVLNRRDGFHSQSLDATFLSHAYYDRFLFAHLLRNAQSTLILGNAAGTAQSQIRHFFGENAVGVELDPAVTRVGRQFFGLPPDAIVIHDDARMYLRRQDERHDLVIVDVFAGGPHIPFHTATVEFYEEVRRDLSPDGLVVLNFPWFAVGTELEEFLLGTLQRVFPHVYLTGHVAYASGTPIAVEAARVNASRLAQPALRRVVRENTREWREAPRSSSCFTDDLAPVERLTALLM
jgi:spermidine synthase